MMMKFSRDQLYQEIWEISARQVANKYALNYPALLKKCKEHGIPLPNGKYWYNKKNGIDIQELIIALPDSSVKEIEVEKQAIKIKKEKATSGDILPIHEDIKETDTVPSIEESTAKFLFDVDWVRSSLDYLESEKIETIIFVLSTFELKENKRLHKKVSSYKESVVNWNKRVKAAERNYYDSRYERNTLEQPKFLKEISSEQLPRLYRILDTIFSVFEQIGEIVTDDLCIRFGKDIVSFEIIESTDKINHELTKGEAQQLVKYNDEIKRQSYASKPNIRKYDYIPNGIFRIKMPNGKYLKDTKSNKLEDMIPEIMLLFYQCYFEIRNRREQWEEAQRIREEEKQKARILQEHIDQEKKKTREFLNILSDYKLANEIRKFVDILKESDKADQETIEWMSRKADWIDPTISVEDKLLGKREHHKADEEKDKFLKEEKYYW
ncbi:cellulose synthase [Listeria monocytogenes]|uniref:cellulose synthase n=1 Tax=Listeria monocytogenes TaxID=1639 RepID=UPI0011C9098F|nr:cellulose synthase [Listeria monocytogenes]EIV7423919.1 cellulose synthase [Listeria monocytogenes]EIV7426216.1 cellulose synthase [Listeria monocytogenes]EKO7300005.1 cellulose synthase [Listeria monocytogenes]EKO7300457.1 cellulose synthase [Listeria monocytogenes]EKO7371319.1 cellulose synthase [Listeria monocytogenes]